MNSRLRALALVAVAAVGLAAWTVGPDLLRRVDWFDVRRVEVTGTRLLTPREVLLAADVRTGQSVWDDRSGWVASLLAHDGIESVTISRRLPATLRIRVEEKQPVAYVEAGALRLATERGEILPVDPRTAAVDLPIVRAEWADSAGELVARRLLSEAGRIARLDPALLREVSEISAAGADALLLSHRLGDLVLPGGVDATRLAELRAVLSDVEARSLADAVDGRPRLTVDLRFRDQIVVRYPSSV